MTGLSFTGARRVNRRVAGAALALIVGAGALAGCASVAPDLDAAAAGQLQSRVLAVTQAAAADDSPGALKQLDELTTALDTAAADGKVSFKRHQSIKSSIDAVRNDLNTRIAQQQAAKDAAAKAAEEEKAAQAARDAAAKAAADQAAADQAAAQQAQQQAAQQAQQQGPGKAKGGKKGG
ncbi:mucin-associated surface protein [Arthrobacter sp. BPSS-3]|uniref:mucin-associated surface protein n=1 Tax=Arthrobacter sp. BPSS-3 TaxID=3366580 RepID=UPI0037DC5FBE